MESKLTEITEAGVPPPGPPTMLNRFKSLKLLTASDPPLPGDDSKTGMIIKKVASKNSPTGEAQWQWRYLSKPRSRKTVLIVDDDAVLRESLAEVLRMQKFEIITAGDGLEAIEVFSKTPVDVVLLDIRMPAVSGWSTFKSLVSSNPYLPVIMMTALPNQEKVANALGVDAIIMKPLDMEELIHLVSEFASETAEARFNRYGRGNRQFRIIKRKSNGFPASHYNE